MSDISLDRVQHLHLVAAELASRDTAFLPIFERMEVELAEAQARAASDPISQARLRLEATRFTNA
ncbi:hypothetical protein JI664_21590 [Rhodobacter sp. NTK016B]|uniref:hypothetical protein n=1 Tax=Rhodobacter sp. NTK016B TaxID=2759676 RepID=UPI001A8C43A5|nr:hypothetical protein [Rhodobacter sp. NTK016B]MBN8294581.1 hypothetical protein [Rhodobacter sp. NTK016B]